MKTDNAEKNIVYFISFFLFSGYYAGLAIVISFGFMEYSRVLYSVPLRVLTTVLMLYVITRNSQALYSNKKRGLLYVFVFFWLLYMLKVLYTYSMNFPLMRSWYEYIFYALNFSVLPFLMFASLDFRKYKDTILNALILSGFILGVVCIYSYKEILSLGLGRISDIVYVDAGYELLSPLALAYSGALTCMLCVYKIVYEGKNRNLFQWVFLSVTFILSLYLFLLGSTRGALIALVLCLPFFMLYGSGRQRLVFSAITLLAIPLLLLGVTTTGSSILERTQNTLETGDSSGRETLWSNAWYEFISYPLLGRRIEIGHYPHNFILEALMSTGFAGFTLLMAVLVTGIKRVYEISFTNKAYILPFIICLQGVSQHFFTGSIYVAVLIFMPLGVIYSSYIKNKLIAKDR